MKPLVLGLTFLSCLAAQVTITSTSPLQSGVATTSYSFTLTASGGVTPYTWTLIGGGLPVGIGLAPSGLISGTANTATVANFSVQVSDSSSSPLTASMAFSLTIAPLVSTGSLPASTINEQYPNTQLNATGLSGTGSWSALNLPAGMSISYSGVLGGTPTASGGFTPTFSVTDPSGAVGSANIPLTIDAAPAITDVSPLPSGDLAVSYSYQFGSSPVSGGTPPYSWSTASQLPPGLTLNSAGLLSGTPTHTGLYTFSMTVTDAETATGSKTFALVVGTLPVQVTLLKSLPASTAGVPYPPPPAADQPPYFQASRGTGGGYTWSASGLPPGLSMNPASGATSGITGNPPTAGTYSGTVTATDSASETGNLGVSITINPTPAINTGALQACTAGTLCTRTLSLTGGTAPFVWSLASGSIPPGMSLSSAGVISGTPSAVGSPTTASFSVTVTDVATASNTQAFTLVVNPAITLTPTSLPATTSGVAYSQTLTTSGGTGTITFAATGLPPWLTLNSSAQLTGTAPSVATRTAYPFSVTATDSDNASATDSYSVVVNPLPTIVNATPLPSWTVNRPYQQTITGTGGTGTLTFSDNATTLPGWLTITGAGLLAGTPPSAGPVSFTLRVTDSVGAFSPKNFTLTINAPPSVTTTSLPATTSAIAYNQTLAETGGTSPLTWAATGLPGWLTLSTSGVLTGTAPAENGPTVFNFSATVTDTAGAVGGPQSLSVTVNPAIQITTASALPTTESGLNYSQTFAATGGTGTIIWSSGNLPPWLTLSGSGGLTGVAPSVPIVTTYNFNVTATDGVGATGSKGFSISVNPLVTITTASPLPAWTLGQPYSQTIAATGGIPGYTFADAATTLPSWLAITPGGSLTGIPTATGTFTFTLKVTDSEGGANTKGFSLKIDAVPTVTTTSLPATTSGLAYNQTLTGTGGTGTLTFAAQGLPSWLTLNGATLQGTAPTGAATSYGFTATVADSTGSVSAAQPLSVTVNPAVVITTSNPLPSAGSGTAYSQTFTATGGTGAITWTFGSLPGWLAQSGATISGTAPNVAQPTTYNFSATATDSLGANSGAQPFNVTVSSGVIIITGASLGPWTATRPYTVTLSASGGTPPYTFSGAGQSLPAWLTLNGAVLSGTPPSAGSFQFTIKATDSLGSSTTKIFTLPINAVPSVTTTSLPPATSGISYTQTLAETGGTTPFTWQTTGLPSWLTLSPAGVLSGIAPAETVATPFSFSVSVTDTAGAVSALQAVSVTVNPGIQILTVSPLPTTESGLSYSQTFAASGGTGAITWSSANLPSWLRLSTGGVLTGTAPAVQTATPYNFNVTATDTVAATASKPFSVTVNQPLSITTASPLPAWTAGQPYSQTIAASGGVPAYTFADAGTTLPGWLAISSAGVLTGIPTAGTFTFTLRVTDTASGNVTKGFSLSIDGAPTVTTKSLPATTSGLAYSQTLAGSGGTGTLTFAAAALPAWITLNGATLSGTAPTVSAATSYEFSATVTDSTRAVSAPQSLSITVNPGVTITTSNPLPSASTGIAYSETFTAGGGTGAITWTFMNRPAWLTQSGATLSGTPPTVAQPTTYTFLATATDSLGASSGPQSFSVIVNSGLVITTGASLGPWTATRPYSVTLTAIGGAAPYSFADAATTLPSWLTINGNVLSGTPPAAGAFQFTIKAVDSLGVSTSKSFTLTINPVPAVTTSALPPTTSGLPYSQSLAASGGTPPLTWNGTDVPGWLALNGPSMLGTAPAVATPTPYAFSISVTDFAGAVSNSQALSVTVNPAVTITTTSPLPPASVGTAYSVAFTATGGTGTITWTAFNLPSWLTLSGSTVSGTPPASAAGSTVSITMHATDSLGAFGSGTFSLTVGSGPKSNGGTLPPWTVNRPYSTTLTITVGTPPYKSWVVSAGSIPAGLQLNSTNGVISGTPTASGAYTFTVSTTDSNSLTIPSTWSMTINPAPAIPKQTLAPATLGSPYSQALTLTGGTAPFTWSATSLNLTGLLLSPDGVLAGVPNATGLVSFSASITDSAGATAQGALSVTVESAILITTASLAETTSTAAYSASLSATGGAGGFTFSAVLPSWLSLNSQGSLTGTAPIVPTATDFDFVVTATDSLGVTGSKLLSVTVNPVPRVLTLRLPAGSSGAPYSTELAARGGTGALKWTAENLPSWASLNSSSGALSGTPPSAATVTISVVVTDSLGIVSPSDSLVLEIDPPGGTPRITTTCPLSPTTAGLSSTPSLTADQGYPPYAFTATGLPPWLVLGANGGFSGTAVAGAYAFTLQVADSHGQDATLACGILVNPTPFISVTSLAPGTVGASYVQTLTASGGTGPLTWSSSSLPVWLTMEPFTGVVSGTPSAAGDYAFTVQVTDTLGAVSAPATITVTVTAVGGLPVITACPLPMGSVGTPMAFQLTAALGFPPYTWSVSGLPAGLTATVAGQVTGTPSAAAVSTVSLAATDSANATVNASCSMRIFATPAVITTSLPNGTVGASYWQRLASAGGVGALQWSISGAPDWLELDPSSGILSGTPDAAGVVAFSVQVTDMHGTQSPTVPLSITVSGPAPANGVTITTSCPLQSITQSMLLDQIFTATGGSPPYSWTAAGLPTGVALDPSGVLLATPTAGTITFSVQAMDQQQQQSAPLNCSVQINPEPKITTSSLPNGIGGTAYLAILSGSGGTGLATWTAVRPYWLSIDPVTGDLSGTPPAAGTVTTTVTLADEYGISNSKTFSFIVAAPATGSLPTLNSACPLPGATVGASYSDNLSAGGGVPPYQFIVSPPIPGLTFSTSGAISGTPQAAGSTLLQVEVIDASGNTATTPCGLAVAGSPVLVILSNIPSGKVNQAYSGGLSASGGAPPYMWSTSSGTLPPGIILSPTSGALSGTPTASGNYQFTATVTDSSRATASANFSLYIAPSLVITSSNLPDATGGIGYQQTLTSTGASGTVTWSIVAGTLPTGLTLNGTTGVVSGSATQAGTFNITVEATDSAGQTAQLPVTINVDLAPIPAVTIAGLPATVTPGQQPTASLTIASAYPLDITGSLNLTVTPDSTIGFTDPAVQFAGGGTSASFLIPANSTKAVFNTSAAFQTGTLAGTIALNVTLHTGGVAVQAPSNPGITGQIPKLAPVIVGTPTSTQSASGLQITIVAYATSRDVTSATFQFAGSNVLTSSLTVPLSTLVGSWYSSAQSNAYGSMFQIVQPFTITGSPSQVSGVTITLTNSVGTSTPITISF